LSIEDILVAGSIPWGSNRKCSRLHDSSVSHFNQNTHTQRS